MISGRLVEVVTWKVGRRGVLAAMVMLLAAQLPSATLAQNGIDRVTGFPRDTVHVAAWPGGRKVAVSFALFVEEFGFGARTW
jgi:allantoinase